MWNKINNLSSLSLTNSPHLTTNFSLISGIGLVPLSIIWIIMVTFPLISYLDILLFLLLTGVGLVLVVVGYIYLAFLDNLGKKLKKDLAVYGIDAHPTHLNVAVPFDEIDWNNWMQQGGTWFWNNHLKKSLQTTRWGRLIV